MTGRLDKPRTWFQKVVVFARPTPTRQIARQISRVAECQTMKGKFGGESRRIRRDIAMIRARKTWRTTLDQLWKHVQRIAA